MNLSFTFCNWQLMARQESDREDIMREATALVERAELRIRGRDDTIIFGLRREGAASIFFGPDPVFHFNSQGELRRAYVSGDLIKAEMGSAVRLRRVRTADELQLQRIVLSPEECRSLLETLKSQIGGLRQALDTSDLELVAAHPTNVDMLNRLRTWLVSLPEAIRLADRPNVE